MTETRKITVDDAMLMGIELHKRGMLTEAQSIYQDVLRSIPDHVDATHYIGVVTHQLGDSEKGIEYIKRSLELVPDQPDAINNLGNINKEIGRLQDAIDAYRKVLEVAPDHTDTWVNCAVVLRELKKPEEALESIKKALDMNPEHGDGHFVLGDIYKDLNRYEDALAAYRKSSEISPESRLLPKSIARLQYANGLVDEAIGILENWLRRRPDDAIARHMLASYKGGNVPVRASDDYIRLCFDNFAKSFDECLKGLEYAAPTLICDLLKQLVGDSGAALKILDIGCGTGLCAPMLRPLAASLTGVDLSPKMLEKARLRELYDQLEEKELTRYMEEHANEFDVIICADTFVYFGDLGPALIAAEKALLPGGLLLFTVEQHTTEERPSNYHLQSHGRYSHTRKYLAETLAKAHLETRNLDDVILRMEDQKPVSGVLVAAGKRGS